MSRTGVKVVLQRDNGEIYVNTYNPLWLEMWDGNMDLSPVKDFFAVVTYITECAFKPEPQELEMKRLLELQSKTRAWRSRCASLPRHSRTLEIWGSQRLCTSFCLNWS